MDQRQRRPAPGALHRWAGAGLAALALAAAGCAGVLGPQTITVSQDKIMAALAKQAPFNLKALDTFDVVALAPRIRMLPESNRIATELELGLTPRFLGHAFKATLGGSYGLRIEPSDQTVRLTDPQIDRVDFDGKALALDAPLAQLALGVARNALNDAVIYRIRPEDVSRASALGFKAGAIRVQPGGLSLTLDPK